MASSERGAGIMKVACVSRKVTVLVFSVAIAALARHAGAADPPGTDDEARRHEFVAAKLVAPAYVFGGSAFPAFDFEQPERVRALIGPYRVVTTYYDREGRRVESAEAPGPYRAVVVVAPESGRPSRRCVTLFRTANDLPADWH